MEREKIYVVDNVSLWICKGIIWEGPSGINFAAQQTLNQLRLSLNQLSARLLYPSLIGLNPRSIVPLPYKSPFAFVPLISTTCLLFINMIQGAFK